MRLTMKLMAGVAASVALFSTAGCHGSNSQPCDSQSSGSVGGAHGGYRMLEFNTDTPTFLYECCHINGLLCAEFGLADANSGQSALLADVLSSACRFFPLGL